MSKTAAVPTEPQSQYKVCSCLPVIKIEPNYYVINGGTRLEYISPNSILYMIGKLIIVAWTMDRKLNNKPIKLDICSTKHAHQKNDMKIKHVVVGGGGVVVGGGGVCLKHWAALQLFT